MKLLTFPNIYFGTLAVFFMLDRFGYLSEHGSCYSLIDKPITFTPFPEEFTRNFKLVLLGVALIPVLHLWRSLIKTQVARRAAVKFAGLGEGTKMDKFQENFWLAFHYICAVTLEVYVMSQMSIWPPMLTHESRVGMSPPYEFLLHEQQTNRGIQAVYLLQFTFYFLELVTLLCSSKKERRSDFMVYLFHHIYTVVLLGVSWITINYRIGLLVLFFHDVADIFLPIGKCATYAETYVRKTYTKMTTRIVEIFGLGSFVCFVVTFIVLRLFFFLYSFYFAIYETRWLMWTLPEDITMDELASQAFEELDNVHYRPHANFYIIALLHILVLLYPMHVFWTFLIIKMSRKLCLGDEYGGDVRSDDEDDDGQPDIECNDKTV